MHLTILAASGGTGRELTRQAIGRGHTVTAIARTPARIAVPDSAGLSPIAADVRDPGSMKDALRDSQVVLSGLGVADGDPAGTTVLRAGGTVFHAGPLTDGPLSPAGAP